MSDGFFWVLMFIMIVLSVAAKMPLPRRRFFKNGQEMVVFDCTSEKRRQMIEDGWEEEKGEGT